jgi:transposase
MWASSAALAVTPEARQELERLVRSGKTEQRIALRARIILGAANGKSNNALARELNTSRPTVIDWRRRFAESGVKALDDDRPRGRSFPPLARTKAAEIITRTQSAPQHATQWSCSRMAKACGVSKASVQRVWHANGLKPHLLKTFKLSNDPDFIEKLEDVVGLYMNPPDHALVFCIDEKSQIQALDRTQPGLPMKKGRTGTMTHDYKRNGTTTLFAALDVLKGAVIGRCMPQHRHQEFLRFLKAIDRSTPKPLDIHCIADNYATHKKQEVKEWLANHPRFHLHFIPTSSSWLNLVERWFGKITIEGSAAGCLPACRNSNAPSTITSNTTMPTRSLSSGQNPRATSSAKSTVAERLCKCRLCRAMNNCKPLHETLH